MAVGRRPAGAAGCGVAALRDRREGHDEEDRQDDDPLHHAHGGCVHCRRERPRAGAVPVAVLSARCRTDALAARRDTGASGGWLGRPSRPRVRAVLLGVVAVAALALPPSAGAHLRSGTVAIDYRARVVDSSTSAYSAQIFQSDRALGVTLKPGHVVMLVGYLGEPVFRLDASGLWVNAASPTAVVDGLVQKSNRVLAATPRWRHFRVDGQWCGTTRVSRGFRQGVRRGVWSVPVIVDGRRSHVRGRSFSVSPRRRVAVAGAPRGSARRRRRAAVAVPSRSRSSGGDWFRGDGRPRLRFCS